MPKMIVITIAIGQVKMTSAAGGDTFPSKAQILHRDSMAVTKNVIGTPTAYITRTHWHVLKFGMGIVISIIHPPACPH